MTERVQNPGAPITDELARNAVRNTIADRLADAFDTGDIHAGIVADTIADEHTVTWETDINAAGVPVRRYVLRGEWEVDPEPAPTLAAGDVVSVKSSDDGREWTVGRMPVTQWANIVGTDATGQAEIGCARVTDLRLLRKAGQ